MPSTTLRPSAVFGGSGSWGGSAAGLVPDFSDANDGTWISDPVLLEDILFDFGDMPVTSGKITSFLLRTRNEQDAFGEGSAFVRYRINGVTTTGSVMGGAPSSVVTVTDDLSAQITQISVANASQFGAYENNYGPSGGPLMLLDQWADVTYFPTQGFFGDSVGQLIGPITALLLSEMPRLATEIARLTRGRLRIEPSEYVTAWRETRARRWRAYRLPSTAENGRQRTTRVGAARANASGVRALARPVGRRALRAA